MWYSLADCLDSEGLLDYNLFRSRLQQLGHESAEAMVARAKAHRLDQYEKNAHPLLAWHACFGGTLTHYQKQVLKEDGTFREQAMVRWTLSGQDAINFVKQVPEGAYGTKENQRRLMVDGCVDEQAWKDAREAVNGHTHTSSRCNSRNPP